MDKCNNKLSLLFCGDYALCTRWEYSNNIIGITKTLLRNTKRLTGRLNFIRCEAHREVLLKLMRDELDKRGNK